MSHGWVDMAREEIVRELSGVDLRGVRFTLCEEFREAPADLRDGQETVGFTLRIADGEVVVEDRVVDDCDVRIISNYDEALTIARDPDAPAAQPDAMQERMADGRLAVVGDPSTAPPALAHLDIHRLLASRTE